MPNIVLMSARSLLPSRFSVMTLGGELRNNSLLGRRETGETATVHVFPAGWLHAEASQSRREVERRRTTTDRSRVSNGTIWVAGQLGR